MNILHNFIYLPTFNALLYLEKILPGHDLGLAIIIVTLVIKFILYFPSLSAIRASRQLQTLQPRLKQLQQQYKNDKETLAREQMKLYKESRVNPAASCLPVLLQLVVFYQLYQVFLNGLKIDEHGLLRPEQVQQLYGPLQAYFSSNPINTMFAHFVDVTKSHNIALAAIAGAAQYWQSKMLASPKEPNIPAARDESVTSTVNKQMLYILPLFTAYFTYRFPAGLALYWTVSSLFTIAQQYLFLSSHPVTPTPAAPINPTPTA